MKCNKETLQKLVFFIFVLGTIIIVELSTYKIMFQGSLSLIQEMQYPLLHAHFGDSIQIKTRQEFFAAFEYIFGPECTLIFVISIFSFANRPSALYFAEVFNIAGTLRFCLRLIY